jgi:hypothetical protein
MSKFKFPPYDSNVFWLPEGRPSPHESYGPPKPLEDCQVETALAYLSQLRPTKQPTFSSHLLKHRAEQWDRLHGYFPYVSNGALIAAAVRLELLISLRH